MEANREGAPFDYVLMDVQMPVMDGNQATRELRSQGYKGVIIALTAHVLPRDHDECIEAGCDQFITKPIDKTEFIHTLQQVYRDCPVANVALEEQQSLLPSGPEQPEEVASKTSGPLYSQLPEDADMRELIEWFVADVGKDAIRIERALEEGDHDRLAVLAHQLKGSAGSYGFPEVTQLAGRLEQIVREGKVGSEISTVVKDFVELCSRVSVR